MASQAGTAVSGADLAKGVDRALLADGDTLIGYVGSDPVLLARRGGDVFAVSAVCTHYSGPLSEGLVVGDTVRCPWHHACFSLRTGEALRAPALNPLERWRVEHEGDKIFVREKLAAPAAARPRRPPSAGELRPVVIVGGGAAGNAAAEMLRREGYGGPVTILSADTEAPYDRPNLSKDYLAGNAPEEWIPLRPMSFYQEQEIALRLGAKAERLDPARREVILAGGETVPYGALLLATGAYPVRLSVPGADLAHVHTLRSLADSRALIAKAQKARQAVVIGTSFIGLEVAASLRARNVEVQAVGLEQAPLERVMGLELGRVIQRLHEEHGVVFHLGTSVSAISEKEVTLANGRKLPADLVVMGVGVRPEVGLAANAGLASGNGVHVNEYLETSAPGVFAAGDAAAWPDKLTGERIRVEHWVVAERQGQAAARNMLGAREPFRDVPFFWSQHYDSVISYVGHAHSWDRVEIEGSLDARDCTVSFLKDGRRLAVAALGRDRESLRAEVAFEQTLAG